MSPLQRGTAAKRQGVAHTRPSGSPNSLTSSESGAKSGLEPLQDFGFHLPKLSAQVNRIGTIGWGQIQQELRKAVELCFAVRAAFVQRPWWRDPPAAFHYLY